MRCQAWRVPKLIPLLCLSVRCVPVWGGKRVTRQAAASTLIILSLVVPEAQHTIQGPLERHCEREENKL